MQILVILMALGSIFSAKVFAQSEAAPSTSADALEPEAEDLPESAEEEFEDFGEIDQDFSNDELALSHREIREKYKWGVGLGIGHAAPWQDLAVAGMRFSKPTYAHMVFLGKMDTKPTGLAAVRRYELTIHSQSLYYAFRGFFWDVVPFFFQPSIGVVSWNGKLAPTNLLEPETEDEELRNLRTNYRAQGIVAGVNIGIMWTWENGIYVEYNLFRIGKSQITSSSLSNDNKTAQSIIEDEIEGLIPSGYANLAIGKLF
ncbi:MAG: hypothetical protein AB7T49_06405 [Oligoflexales bacterium]